VTEITSVRSRGEKICDKSDWQRFWSFNIRELTAVLEEVTYDSSDVGAKENEHDAEQ
jgi:hypothetical protein